LPEGIVDMHSPKGTMPILLADSRYKPHMDTDIVPRTEMYVSRMNEEVSLCKKQFVLPIIR
jgi:hypothetical protein